MSADAASLRHGPPEADDAEHLLVGAALCSQAAYATAAETVEPWHFRRPGLGAVWTVLAAFLQEGQPWSVELIWRKAQFLRAAHAIEATAGGDDLPAAGLAYLNQLADLGSGGAHVGVHAPLVVDAALRREAFYGAAEGVRAARTGSLSVAELASHHRRLAERLEAGVVVRTEGHAQELVDDAFQAMSTPRSDADGSLSWGLPSLDRMGLRIEPGSYPVLAAMTGGGKTTLAVQAAFGAAERTGRPVVYVSLEMPPEEIARRAIIARSGQPAAWQGSPSTESIEAWGRARDEIRAIPVFIPRVADRSLESFLHWLSAFCRNVRPVAVFVDHLGLLHSGARDIYTSTTQVSQRLRAWTLRDEAIPIVALAQLRRTERGKDGASRAPELHDLKDSGSIENDATCVLMIDRPWIRATTEGRKSRAVSETEAALYVKKNRHGSTHRRIALHFDGARCRVLEVEKPHAKADGGDA